jgi:hypothetical protein
MDMATRLKNFVGKQAIAQALGKGIVAAVEPPSIAIDDIERAISWSTFTVRLDDGRGTVAIPGFSIYELDNNAYLVPADCPWMELAGR